MFKSGNRLIIAILMLTLYATAHAEVRTVTASGKGEVLVPQTIAAVQISVSEDGKSAIEAQNNVRIKSAKLLKVLKTEKTLSMETTAVTVNPTMSYTDNKPKIIGYNASYSVQVKALIENMGNIIDHAVTAGATIVDEPRLTASDADTAKAEKEAIKLATLDAKSRAEASLTALGFKPITVTQITVQNLNNHPQPMSMTLMKTADSPAAAPPTQIISGKATVTADVSLSITY